ncbi:cytochrome c oxidase assembly factor 3, mitochondrial-like [Vespa mandarinia]|uniref:cytochrome c oxidase assembly factor 3, mitochondrial-like n=1 Tax=Vespa mandarinia TaxID=7446 RepID=UPI001607E923|nr:cytochrome c oxidase assembly factor 3, mitochondrial-like [Vespa mandarinia]
MDKNWMPKVDLKKDNAKIKNLHITLMNEIEKQNSERVKDLIKIRRSNRILGCILGGTVFSIYFYTIYSVKQEKFLDDLNEPEKVIVPPQTNA